MILGKVFSPNAIKVNLKSTDKKSLFGELVDVLGENYPSLDKKVTLKAIIERESKMTTGIMSGVAVPHGRVDSVQDVQGVIGISSDGIEYDSIDGQPVHLVFLMVSSPASCESHLQALKRLARILENSSFREQMKNVSSSQEAYELLCKFESEL